MQLRRLFPALIFVLAICLLSLASWFLYPRNKMVVGDDYQGVIFHRNYSDDELGMMLMKDIEEDAYWTPSKAEISILEDNLKRHVQDQMPVLALNLANYKRQYFGFIRQGRKLVFLVGFCKTVEIDWRRRFVPLPMAATCYFEAQYDLESQQLLYIWQYPER